MIHDVATQDVSCKSVRNWGTLSLQFDAGAARVASNTTFTRVDRDEDRVGCSIRAPVLRVNLSTPVSYVSLGTWIECQICVRLSAHWCSFACVQLTDVEGSCWFCSSPFMPGQEYRQLKSDNCLSPLFASTWRTGQEHRRIWKGRR